jgi:hypothetical protein
MEVKRRPGRPASGLPPKEQVALYLAPGARSRIDAAATLLGVDVSVLCREILMAGLEAIEEGGIPPLRELLRARMLREKR